MADLTRHPDVVDLAEYAEGVLDTGRQSTVEQHVRECADCAIVLDNLAELPDVLAQAPMPPMPPDVTARLDQAIAAEAASRASPTATSHPSEIESSVVVALRPRRRWLAPVLAAAAVIGVIGIAVPVVSNGSGGEDDDSAAGSAESAGDTENFAEDGARQESPPVSAPIQPGGQPPVELSSDRFARDVADAFYPDASARRLRKADVLASEDGTGFYYREEASDLCPNARAADHADGRVEDVLLDGQPAFVLLSESSPPTYAIAFSCDGDRANVLAGASLLPR